MHVKEVVPDHTIYVSITKCNEQKTFCGQNVVIQIQKISLTDIKIKHILDEVHLVTNGVHFYPHISSFLVIHKLKHLKVMCAAILC